MAGDYFPSNYFNTNMWHQSPQSNVWFPSPFATHNLNSTYFKSVQFSVFKQNPHELHKPEPVIDVQFSVYETIGITEWIVEEHEEKVDWSKEGF